MSTGTRAGAQYVRATVLGSTHNADLVLPADQPLGLLMPQLLDLLHEPNPVGRVDLVAESGAVLDPDLPLGAAELPDGARLRVVLSREAPPAAVVYEVVDVVEKARPSGTWSVAGRAAVLSVVAVVCVAAAIWLGTSGLTDEGAPTVLGLASLLALLGASLCAQLRALPQGWVLAGFGAATGGVAVATLEASYPERFAWAALLLVLVALVVGHCVRRVALGAVATAALMVLAGVAFLTWSLTDHTVQTGAVTAVAALFLLGLLPRVALTVSGVFRMDAVVTDGDRVLRRNAAAGIVDAHWMLLGGVLVVSTVLGVASWAAGRHGELEPWALAVVLLTAVAFGLRGRHFPLTVQRGAVWLAAMCGPFGLLQAALEDDDSRTLSFAVGLALLGLVILAGTRLRTNEHQGALIRRSASRLETVTVLAVLPVLVGVFGVYRDLLNTF